STMSLIGGMAQTEANEVEARNRAIRERRGSYSHAYGKPHAIPEGRWFRWGYPLRPMAGGRDRKSHPQWPERQDRGSRPDLPIPPLRRQYHHGPADDRRHGLVGHRLAVHLL